MQGKIALEEHFALADTFTDTKRFPDAGVAEDLRRRLLDIQEIRLREMDEFGIELGIQSLNAPGVQGEPDTAKAIALARRGNDVLAEEVAKRPDRFAGFAALPMQDPEAATAELVRCVNDLGFVGAMLNGFTQRGAADSAVYYDAAEFRPFWAEVERLDVPLYLHPRNPLRSRLQLYDGHPWLENSAWAFAMETAMHALRLMCSGLFDEYPGVQIVLGHLGERIPFDLWRVDHRIAKSPQGMPAEKPLRHYWQNNFHITTSGNFHDPTLACALAESGVDRVMFSVDYPFETTADACNWFDNSPMPEAQRQQIGRDNAVRLFRLALD